MPSTNELRDPTSAAERPLWGNRRFTTLFWAHVVSLVGSGVSSVALGLLAKALVGGSATTVLGFSLTIRILVLVFFAPAAGGLAVKFGRRRMMIAADILRVIVVSGFFFVDSVWQIYVLAFFLHLGSALFTPVYKSVIPGVVGEKQYPKALAFGTMAYDISTIAGPSLAAGFILAFGIRGNFLVDAATFLLSAIMIMRVRFPEDAPTAEVKPPVSLGFGIRQMLVVPGLRRSLILALWVSVAGALALVSTVGYVTIELGRSDAAYAWVMAGLGLGSTVGAFFYAQAEGRLQESVGRLAGPVLLGSVLLVSFWPGYAPLFVAWLFSGAAQSILLNRSNKLLAANSSVDDRAHIYAAHFSLSHVGWGVTYPAAGLLTTHFGFRTTAVVFAAVLCLLLLIDWMGMQRKSK